MGQGKPLKSILHGKSNYSNLYRVLQLRKGVSTAAEIADGCILVWMNPKKATFGPNLALKRIPSVSKQE